MWSTARTQLSRRWSRVVWTASRSCSAPWSGHVSWCRMRWHRCCCHSCSSHHRRVAHSWNTCRTSCLRRRKSPKPCSANWRGRWVAEIFVELLPWHIDGLVQERRNCALAVELRLSSTNPSIWIKVLTHWTLGDATVMLKLISRIGILSICCEIAPRWMPQDDKSSMIQIMAGCCHALSHYLNQYWQSSMTPYGIARPQWV